MESSSAATPAGTVVLTVSGMTCGGCAGTVARVLARVPGVENARVDLASGRATVIGTATAQALLAAIAAAGFDGGIA
jgi:copper chaperone